MEKNGFDNFKPIDVWQGIVIDGNSRFKAAIMAGIKEVAVYEHNFRNQEEALEYAIHNQRGRRNITEIINQNYFMSFRYWNPMLKQLCSRYQKSKKHILIFKIILYV
jgi:ParB-like chromosome segregation protein Spo0J